MLCWRARRSYEFQRVRLNNHHNNNKSVAEKADSYEIRMGNLGNMLQHGNDNVNREEEMTQPAYLLPSALHNDSSPGRSPRD